ncbi:DgyrCDS9097 [Dimorphilus gyrociliatus]|uniref:DgyrCDS9097 n=1 Tax=Dimorphilus gyrociliatus TaxID=2664684 RepID=A0A7I8VW24_9ANNE|nr:DgyrCDS9097 [Dimorphilus gyrociliatus]
MRLQLVICIVYVTMIEGRRDSCSSILKRIYQVSIEDVTQKALEGDWTSNRCEVRPGPEYLLRRYTIYRNNIYSINQFYYGDAECAHPLFSIYAQGYWKVSQTESIANPGAYRATYENYQVSITPFTNDVALKLYQLANDTCEEKKWLAWKAGQTIEIQGNMKYHDRDVDFDCLHSFDFTLNELQLVRVEEEKQRHRLTRRLLLGDVHTERKNRITHKPNSFQTALISADTPKCSICKIISKSTSLRPPSLHHHRQNFYLTKLSQKSEWLSERCESTRFSNFLIRHLILEDRFQWKSIYHYYSDVICKRKLYTIVTSGTWEDSGPHKHMTGTRNVIFNAFSATLKVTEKSIATILNAAKGSVCGDGSYWHVGSQKDLTISNGCPTLGISLPYTIYEIIRLEKRFNFIELFLGKHTTNWISTINYRPTSFQEPLKFCGNNNIPLNYNPKNYIWRSHLHAKSQGNGCKTEILTLAAIFCLIRSFV